MINKEQSCGFGFSKKKQNRRYTCKRYMGASFGTCTCDCCKGTCDCCKGSSFGASFQSFYPEGAKTNTFLTPEVKKCLNIVYGPKDSGYTSTSYPPDIQNSLGFGSKHVSNEIGYLRSLF